MPYFSDAISKNPLVYDALSSSMSDICHHIHCIVAQLLPSEYIEIKAFVDVLPLNHSPITYPFGGMVLNIQASSSAHKDHRDKIYCVTVPFGVYKDGELVLHMVGVGHCFRMASTSSSFLFIHFNEYSYYEVVVPGHQSNHQKPCSRDQEMMLAVRSKGEVRMELAWLMYFEVILDGN
jgi:hypothetical protein